jgi:CheY-like chemotaxis protein
MTQAIVIAPIGTAGALGVLVERLAGAGVAVAVADDLATAVDHAQRDPAHPPCILLDLRDATGELEELKRAVERVKQTIQALPTATPVCITSAGDPALIVACIRAGAADVIDLKLEGTAGARAVVQRVAARQEVRAAELERASALRNVLEDLMKALIRTERRTIDLEEEIARPKRRPSEQPIVGPDARSPAILVVEQDRRLADQLVDRLEDGGIATFAYSSGVDAVRATDALLASGGSYDLALISVDRGTDDGLETVAQLRERISELPAFLMTTDDDDDELADQAVELGVVGFVKKPIEDVEEVVARLAELAKESLARTREAVYLARIKERHERVLARYRSLPREP